MRREPTPATGELTPSPPSARRSLRVRLTLWVVLLNSVILWSAGAIFWLYQSAVIEDVVRSGLLDQATVLARRIAPYVGAGDEAKTALGQAIELLQSDARRIRVVDAAGDNVAPSTVPEFMISTEASERTIRTGEPSYFGHTVRPLAPGALPIELRVIKVRFKGADGNWYALSVATASEPDQREIGLLTRILVLVITIGTIASAISGWFVAGVAVAPLRELKRIASRLSPDVSATALEAERGGASPEVSGLVRELDVARSRFRERFEAQERFLLNASHEFKTPISVLLTEAQTLNRSGLDDEGRRFVESVEQEMLTLGRLIESFLTLTRLEVEGRAANFRPYAINDLVMDCVGSSHQLAEHHGVTLAPSLIWHHGDDVNAPASLHGEPELLRTMLENLIRNAIRFAPERSVVEIATFASAGTAVLAVRDRGPGIPPEQLERIFDRFSRANDGSPASRGRGHGLGLAIAMGIAELHGGTIVATNRPAGGCEFRITLPLPGHPGAPVPKSDDDSSG